MEQQIMSDHLKRGNQGACEHPPATFVVQDEFYGGAAVLRDQFESCIRSSASQALTPFIYAFRENEFSFLSASSERLFSPDALSALIESLTQWGAKHFGTSRVSTPQARLFVSGCSRQLLQDDIAASLHYLLSLTANDHLSKRAELKTLVRDCEQAGAGLERILTASLQFNRLIVHVTDSPYSVTVPKTTMNPLEGAFLLEGYMW